MQEFRVFRAIGLSFKSLFRNFIPFAILTAILYAPAILYIQTMDMERHHTALEFSVPDLIVLVAGLLLPAFMTYRVIQELNGSKSSMLTSVRLGMRGILPPLIAGIAMLALAFIPIAGLIIDLVLMCVWYVAAPAAVAEKLNPVAALSRSAELTRGRRWGIFGLLFLFFLIAFAVAAAYMGPLIGKPDEMLRHWKSVATVQVVMKGVMQMFGGTVAAVSYALLRADKDGMTHEQLAAVFE